MAHGVGAATAVLAAAERRGDRALPQICIGWAPYTGGIETTISRCARSNGEDSSRRLLTKSDEQEGTATFLFSCMGVRDSR